MGQTEGPGISGEGDGNEAFALAPIGNNKGMFCAGPHPAGDRVLTARLEGPAVPDLRYGRLRPAADAET